MRYSGAATRAATYALFASAATLTNVATQAGVSAVWPWRYADLFGLAGGTLTGLGLKYLLDKQWIFRFHTAGIREYTRRFLRYAATGVVTTAIFWGTELTFLAAFHSQTAKYVGAFLGLGIGYTVKYFLDARFVFTHDPPSARKPRDPTALLVSAAAFGLYWFTSARAPGWVDATLILNGAERMQLGTWVNTHNLFNVLGHYWLLATFFLDPHRSLTLLCTIFGSLTVLFLYLTAVTITRNRIASVFTSIAIVLSHSLWWHSATIEVYTLNTLLIAAILYLIFRYAHEGRRRGLYIAFFLGGLGVSNHVLMGLYVPAFALLSVLLIRERRILGRHLVLLLLAAVAGGSLYLVIFIQDLVAEGHLGGVVKSAMGGGFLQKMFPSGMSPGERLFWAGNYLFLLIWNFPSAAIVFAVAAIPRLPRKIADPAVTGFFFAGLIAQVIWSANYLIWDMYAFALPVYIMLSVPLAVGIDSFVRTGSKQRVRLNPRQFIALITFALPLLVYPTFAHWPGREHIVDTYISLYPEAKRLGGYWDPAEYVFNPVKRNYTAVERFANGWMARIPPGAHYWDDESKAAYPLQFYYQSIRRERTDVTIHAVFGIMMTETQAQYHAREIQRHLSRGDPVFISSLAEPEREILNQLYHLENPEMPLVQIRALGEEELVATFPNISIRDFPLGVNGMPDIFRLVQ